MGGAIAPGLKTSAAALFEHTAKLPNVDLEIPGKYICKNTNEGMQSGLIYGHMGFTERMVSGMKKEMSKELNCKPEDIKVIATGGMATMIERDSTRKEFYRIDVQNRKCGIGKPIRTCTFGRDY